MVRNVERITLWKSGNSCPFHYWTKLCRWLSFDHKAVRHNLNIRQIIMYFFSFEAYSMVTRSINIWLIVKQHSSMQKLFPSFIQDLLGFATCPLNFLCMLNIGLSNTKQFLNGEEVAKGNDFNGLESNRQHTNVISRHFLSFPFINSYYS